MKIKINLYFLFFYCQLKFITINPVINYISSIYEIIYGNLDAFKNYQQDAFFLNDKIVNFNTIKFLKDFIFYYKAENYHSLEKLWGDIVEKENKEKLSDDNHFNQLVNDPKIYKLYQLMEKAIINNNNPENILELLMANHYFSIYTQKFLLIFFFNQFIAKESPEKIHSLLGTFEMHYPESSYLIWMHIITIISYYENLSPWLHQSNFDYIHQILSLIDTTKQKIHQLNLKKYNDYWDLLEDIKIKTEFINCEKDIYKALTLINNGQMGVGYNMFKKALKNYKKLLNKSLTQFNSLGYINLDQPSNWIKSILLTNKDNVNLFITDTLFLKNHNNSIVYQYKNFPLKDSFKNNNINNYMKIQLLKKNIKKSPSYKKYIKYKNLFKTIQKHINK